MRHTTLTWGVSKCDEWGRTSQHGNECGCGSVHRQIVVEAHYPHHQWAVSATCSLTRTELSRWMDQARKRKWIILCDGGMPTRDPLLNDAWHISVDMRRVLTYHMGKQLRLTFWILNCIPQLCALLKDSISLAYPCKARSCICTPLTVSICRDSGAPTAFCKLYLWFRERRKVLLVRERRHWPLYMKFGV